MLNAETVMARPIIFPVSVHSTAPETFVVLNQRMKVVEEQTNALLKELHTLGIDGQSMELFPSKPLEDSEGHQTISPVRARTAFGGAKDTLWQTCETLVNRMCRLESVVQTMKLSMFRLQTEKELNPKHAANLEQRLNAIQEEHFGELKVLQMEGRVLCQQLRESREEEEKARGQVQKLSAALEIATATKRDVTVAADELRAAKNKMNRKLQELTEKLSKESSTRQSLEESQAVLLYRMHEMEATVENERKQVHILQEDCNSLRQDIEISRERLRREEEKALQLEQQCTQLKSDLESRENTISRLNEEGKAARLSLSREHEENTQLRSEIASLREVAEEVQVLNEQLTQQCAEMNDTLRSVTAENAQLISDHQAALKVEQDKINQKLQEQDLILDAARASITAELQIVQNEKAQLQREIEALRVAHAACGHEASELQETTTAQKELLESTVAKIRSELEAALQERDSLLKEKERLEEQMQKTVHEITEENKRLEAELTEHKLEIGPLKDTVKVLEEENKKLMEREAALEHQHYAQQQVKQVLEELTDTKNKLAYEKGKLQTRVKQLEEKAQSLQDTRSENSRLRKLNTTLETKCNQMSTELASIRINTQRMEAKLKQTQSALVCREDDFSVTVKTRDEALRENQKLKGQISATEEREKHKMTNLRRKLEESKEDNAKVTAMLENVLGSHNKMQVALEKVQTELGRKDSEVAELKKDRTQSQQRILMLEAELEECHSKMTLQSQHSFKMEALCKILEASKADNKKLAQNLEQTLQTNSALQSKLMLIRDELESKEAECQELMECRDQLIEETKLEVKLYADRLETLKKQFQNEREVTKKAAQKESAELKKALEEACTKSGEMSRLNRELRAKVAEQEAALASQKEKLKRQKALITQYFNARTNNAQNAGRIKEIETELRQMEEMKQQYQKKNHEQSLRIKEFVAELTTLQGEMQQLARNQQAMETENRNLENQLVAEQKQRQRIQEECQALEDTVRHLKKCKEETEQKLKEASKESEHITANLEEAHHWFKSKFDSLQRELVKNRQKNLGEYFCEEHEKEERPTRLPSQACLKRWETKNHLQFIKRKYLSELNK
nr:coiled-coil domain-containing protein 150 isoform X4 [Podarcis muralis]XP_028607803.1 coiled-coil domain-containing protein 150 isoform X4 [Podarcis muralis]XP_028607810.1 coiled-coil domain-containing protein 150 isoform X4 [Podarcis muralis]XP_028607820.1 coiled-coil domain-containing protein 150 isoform X4 [Podarcis muralis]XP_028607829.1 coiled-coil domain-containing protein 150 isoform X4 [Podarcis muralis]